MRRGSVPRRNIALDQRRASQSYRRHRRQIENWSQAVGQGSDSKPIEDRFFERRCAQILDRGLRAGIQKLDPGARRLLQLHVVHGLSIDVLGRVYSVHRATVARRIRRHLNWLGANILELIALEVGELSEQELAHVAHLWHRYSEFTASGIFPSSGALPEVDGEAPVEDDADGQRPVTAQKAKSRRDLRPVTARTDPAM